MTEPVQSAPPESWRPANPTEHAMVDALTRGDKRRYFEIVMTSDLFLPAFSETHGKGGQQFLAGDMDGQPYLMVFTSVEALQAQVSGAADACVTIGYRELRQAWPHPFWKLAINPGSPLDAYLAVDAVELAANGELDIPRAADLIESALGEMQRPVVDDPDAAMRAAAERGDWRGYFDGLSVARLVVPTLRPVEPEELVETDFPWRVTGHQDDPAIEVFTSVDVFAQVLGPTAPYVTIACPFVVAAWPGDSCAMSVNPGTAYAARLPGSRVPLLLLWPGDGVEFGPDELVAALTTPDGP